MRNSHLHWHYVYLKKKKKSHAVIDEYSCFIQPIWFADYSNEAKLTTFPAGFLANTGYIPSGENIFETLNMCVCVLSVYL